MIRQTSIESYHKIKREGLLNRMNMIVYECIYHHGPLTIKEACSLLPNFPETSISPVFARLKAQGVVSDFQKRPCKITGNTVLSWDVTKDLPTKPEKFKRNLYGKIYCEEGVIRERRFKTEAEALAFVDGFNEAKDLTSNEDEDQLYYYQAGVDSEEAKDEG